jgi:hypothetical protein
VELLGSVLSTILQAEIRATAKARCAERLQTEALTDANVNASIGLAMRSPSAGLKNACETADWLMYEEDPHNGERG